MTDREDTGEWTGDIRLIGRRAVNFQEFLTRRAWGFFYGVWAIDFLLIVVGSFFFNSYADLVFSFIAIFSGYFVSTGIFGKARRASRFRAYLEGSRGSRAPSRVRRYFFVTIVFYAAVIALIIVFPGKGRISDYLSSASYLAMIFLGGIGTFFASLGGIGKLVPENIIATFTLLSGGLAELILGIFRLPVGYEFLGWSLVVAAWIVSSLLSFYYASEVLGGISGE